jgi:glycosyltransferase involved in cell wall biosynthesis
LKEVFSRLIVLTTWETDALPPSFVDLLNQVKEVWVPCRYNFDVFRRQLKTPVFQIPHAVHTACASCFDTNEINKRFQLKEDSFVFLSTGTWQERKNLSAIIEAFLRAFPDEPNAVLIIKTLFDFTNESLARAQIFAAIQRANPPNARKAAERIKIYAEFWPDQLMQALAKRADCYVSLHRGEGWCYPLFDAACMGTPVISTAYSGPMDYLDSRYHRLVRYELTPAMRDKQGAKFAFSPDMSWAAPDVIHAASLMREVYDHRQQAMQQAEEGSIPLLRKYSSHAVGRMAAQRLTELAENICCAA